MLALHEIEYCFGGCKWINICEQRGEIWVGSIVGGNHSYGKGRNPHIASTISIVQFHTARAYPMLSAVFVININITNNRCRMVWQADCWHIRQKNRLLGIRLEYFNFPLPLEGLCVKQQNWGSFHFIQTECLLWQTEMILQYLKKN